MNIIEEYQPHVSVKFTPIFNRMLSSEDKIKALKAERKKISLLIPHVYETDQYSLKYLIKLLRKEMKKYSHITKKERESRKNRRIERYINNGIIIKSDYIYEINHALKYLCHSIKPCRLIKEFFKIECTKNQFRYAIQCIMQNKKGTEITSKLRKHFLEYLEGGNHKDPNWIIEMIKQEHKIDPLDWIF